MPEMEELFHLVLSKDELTVLVLGQQAVSGLFDGDVNGAMIGMIGQYISLRLATPAKLEDAHHRLLSKVEKLAQHYHQQNNKPHV